MSGTTHSMAVVNVEVRPGVTLLMDAREAAKRGLEPIRPGATKKMQPAAAKKAGKKKAAPVEVEPVDQDEDTDGVRNN